MSVPAVTPDQVTTRFFVADERTCDLGHTYYDVEVHEETSPLAVEEWWHCEGCRHIVWQEVER